MRSVNEPVILLITIFLVFVSCNNENAIDCLKKTGEITTREYSVGYFHTIEAIDEADIYLLNAETQRIEVKAGKNLLSNIQFEVKDSVLTIRNKNRCNWVRTPGNPGIYIYNNQLRRIDIYDYSNFYTLDSLHLNGLELFSDGTGNFDLKLDVDTLLIESIYISNFKIAGTVDFLKILFTNDSRFEGKELISEYNEIHHTGSNLIELYPIKVLSGELNSTGDLYYYHDPEILDISISGTGQLVDRSS